MAINYPHVERVLFVIGRQRAGKSTLLRQMFVDPRFARRGSATKSKRGQAHVRLSPGLCLHIRYASPHEWGDTLEEFFAKIDDERRRRSHNYWRFNFACALQPTQENNMPGIVETCRAFQKRFDPERIRVVQISPRQDKRTHDEDILSSNSIDQLRRLGVEFATIDGRRETFKQATNGWLLADFFNYI